MAAQKALYVVTHPTGIVWPPSIVGVSALAVMFLLSRTRLPLFARADRRRGADRAWSRDGARTWCETVADVGAIPSGLPPLVLPHLSDLTVGVVSGALSRSPRSR